MIIPFMKLTSEIFWGTPCREKSWNLKPFDKWKVELTKQKRIEFSSPSKSQVHINISMFDSNGKKFQCLILIFPIVKQKNDCKYSSICPTNNPFHVLIGFKVIQVLLDDPDDTWEIPIKNSCGIRKASSTTDPLQMLLLSEFSSGFFHTQNWWSSRLILECTWEAAGLVEQVLRQAASSWLVGQQLKFGTKNLDLK